MNRGHEPECLLSRPVGTLSSPPSGGEGRGEEVAVDSQRIGDFSNRRFMGSLHELYLRIVSSLGCLGLAILAGGAEIKWKQGEGSRSTPVAFSISSSNGFTLQSGDQTGIRFTNSLAATRSAANQNLLNGSGVALGDYDGDGWCDIYLCDLGGTNVLFRNLGNWKFQDVTREAGVACPGQTSTGAVFADLNGDGWLDLLVTSMGGPNACFINDGHGHFTNITAAAGLVSRLGSTSMALGDLNGDGTLDLYVANYGVNSILRSGGALNVATGADGRPIVRGRFAQRIKIVDGVMYELGEPDALYFNDGHGRFKSVSWTDGSFLDEAGRPLSSAPWDQGLSVLFRDLNEDGFPDIYVCNDAFTPDRCWLNDGRGHFRALSTLALRQTSYFSMGADVADIDRDGHDDLLVVDMQSRNHELLLTQKGNMHSQPRVPGDLGTRFQVRRNTLFHGRGDGTFAEMANFSGVASSEWTWSCLFLDVDLDGWEDILISNGFPHNVDDLDTQDRIKKMGRLGIEESRRTWSLFPALNTPNIAFRNQRDLTFREMGREWHFDSTQVSNGMALGDLDNDGDLDVVVNCLNAGALVYRNDASAPRIGIQLRGRAPNTQGIGARLKLLGGPVSQSQEVVCGGAYMSGSQPMRVFAAGSATNLVLEVKWRSGKTSVHRNLLPNHIYQIDEPVAELASVVKEPAGAESHEFFKDVSSLLGHAHHEELFDDFARQPLLPNRLSQLGPGVSWFDIDGDGREDLIVGTGKGGRLAVFRNDPEKGFVPLEAKGLSPAAQDQTAIVGWAPAMGRSALWIGSANYENGPTNDDSVLRFDFQNRTLIQATGLPGRMASAGPICMADIDGDGDLDLFVGSRVIPGRYPESGPSRLYRNNAGRFELDVENSERLKNAGMVSGACFADLDNDGFAELILATEWGPVRVFHNDHGHFQEATERLGLSRLVGWWNGIAAGDLDGDGRLDLVVGNWGLNSQYRASEEHPARLFFGDLGGNGRVDLLEAYDDERLGTVPWRGLDAVAASMPFLRDKFSTHRAYAAASINEILGGRAQRARELRATSLASMAYLNRGDHFEAAPLPTEAQLAPVFGVCIADLDGDGHEDVFLSQNFFATQPTTPRLDAGRGLWLRGDGTGRLLPVSGQKSGIKVYGEQRGAALCDYDADGRVDLVVTQNGGETKLYHNEEASPGLRVRLIGPSQNPFGIGTTLRLKFGERTGPLREVRAGGGYWSQDSPLPVLGMPVPAKQILIRWPGGQMQESEIPKGAKEISVSVRGEIKLLR